MCGISGIITRTLPESKIVGCLQQMGRIQQHRGPDDQQVQYFPTRWGSVGFGFVRLSILDLETGMQPIRCPADDTTIVCNGQIYNYIELRPQVGNAPFVTKGDIEVALHLYRTRGIAFLNDLNGMYAGAIFDPVQDRVILFRDRFGIKPLYYATFDDGFAFASEITPLLSGLSLKRELNTERLTTYFTYRYVPGGETLFSGIHRLPPGSYLVFDLRSQTYEIHRYWDYRVDRESSRIDIRTAARQFYEIYQDAVRIRLRSDVELGSFISGGIDSSAVSSEAVRYQPDLRLFTIAFEEGQYNELPFVRGLIDRNPDRFGHSRLQWEMCKKNDLKRLPEIVRAIEEPISLGTLLPTDQVCRLASRKVKTVLTGEGADEIFAGYRKFMIEMAAFQFNDFSPRRRKTLLLRYPELQSFFSNPDAAPEECYIRPEALFSDDELLQLTGQKVRQRNFPADARPYLSGREHPVNAAIAYESRFRLPDYVILRLDKLSMRHSLETRTPLLDYRLAEFAATLPVQLKVNPGLDREKMICSYAYLKYGVLDAKAAFRRKQPFTIPMANWLSAGSDLPDFLKEILFGDIIRTQNLLDPDFVKSLAMTVTAEGIGPQTLVSAADRLFAVIIFTLWYQEFMC